MADINVFDSSSVDDTIQFYPDSVATSESVIFQLNPVDLIPFDSVATSESTSANLNIPGEVFDVTTVTDEPGFYPDLTFVTEFVSVSFVSPLAMDVFDDVSATEDTQLFLDRFDISAFDSSTTSEFVTLEIGEPATVSDDVNVTDNPGFYPDLVFVTESVSLKLETYQNLSVFDDVTTSEETDLFIYPLLVDVFNSSTVTESLSEVPLLAISVEDSSPVTDNPGFYPDLIFVTESTSLNLQTYQNLSVSDDATTSEETVLLVNPLFVDTFDSSTVTESVSELPLLVISVDDTSTAIDFPGFYPDTVYVTESISLSLQTYRVLSVFDSSTVSESTSLLLSEAPGVFDNVNVTATPGFYPDLVFVTEAVSLLVFLPTYYASVFDSTTISEFTALTFFQVVTVFDAVTTSESVSLVMSSPNISVFDATTATEFANANAGQTLPVFETVTTSEFVDVILGLNVSVFDSSPITEFVNVVQGQNLLVFDSVTTSDSASMTLPIDQGLLIHIDTYDD
jgi:hypothetical protein